MDFDAQLPSMNRIFARSDRGRALSQLRITTGCLQGYCTFDYIVNRVDLFAQTSLWVDTLPEQQGKEGYGRLREVTGRLYSMACSISFHLIKHVWVAWCGRRGMLMVFFGRQ